MSQPIDRRRLPAGLRLSGWTAPDGWLHRRYDWTPDTASRGSILFLSGRDDCVEKYLEAIARWHDAGWHVAGFDWRGQGGSGRTVPGHLASFDPLVDDLAAFAAAWRMETPGPHILVGHSMGGHVVLRALAERRVGADAAVLAAPLLGLAAGRAGRLAAFLMGLFGRTLAPVGRTLNDSLRRRRLTGSVERFEDAAWWARTQPGCASDPPTWGWLHAAYDSVARLARPGALDAVGVPVLVLRARRDSLVRTALARRIPAVRIVTLPGAHELLREADPVRLAALDEIDRFLAAAAPAR